MTRSGRTLTRFPLLLALAAVVAAAIAPSAVAQSEFFKQRRSNEGAAPEEWKEQEVALPAAPREEDLLALPGRDLPRGYTYLLDTRSLTVGEDDGVIRYTMVIQPDGGLRHVVYEGMRCWPEASRVYAVGTSEGLRARAGEPWRALPDDGPFVYRRFLHEVIACDIGNQAFTAEEIVDRLRRPQVRSANQERQPWFHEKRQ